MTAQQTEQFADDDSAWDWLARVPARTRNAVARAFLGSGMSDRTWATYWKAEGQLSALAEAGGPDVREELYRAAGRGSGRLNVSKFARLTEDAIRSWLLTDAGRAYLTANLQNGDGGDPS